MLETAKYYTLLAPCTLAPSSSFYNIANYKSSKVLQHNIILFGKSPFLICEKFL